ncbi:hypothetical protein CANARDRAFT_26787 [[Candida] arabinofermentans NRRL YB-2248]|uniref:Dolichyl-diphosphooligosaccharide--protein glycosyltransferase subunit 1 n=1 Tax=[Candida] arabinofermentans NRRL YB-2248 TaxID=983967 RepID=A0A1E4T6K2_9ASCO|nr:hypothetical protein CANARDRAFT_26787 [[Candida] arabinofermentans NRRL YB-2248]
MRSVSIYCILAYLLVAVSALTPEKVWENVRYDRTLDLQKSYAKERHVITAKNIAAVPISEYYFSIPAQSLKDISLFIAFSGSSKDDSSLLQADEIVVPQGESDSDLTYYKLQLPYPIAPKSQITLTASYITTKQLSPLPKKADMGAEQTLIVQTHKLPLSCYDTSSYVLRVAGADSAQELPLEVPQGFTSQDLKPTVKDSTLLYGPYSSVIESYTKLPMALLYSKQLPLPVVHSLKRDFWVSHWSSALQLEEYYELTNAAVALNKGFSRVDWMSGRYHMRQNPVLTNIPIRLPEVETSEIYFTDKVGNVSTSLILDKELILKPRYPIFGDWNYNFTIGWTNKLADFVKSSDDVHILKVPLLDGLTDATYENVSLSIRLPEGSKIIDVQVPFDHNGMTIEQDFSYLDLTTGHTKVTLEFNNLVDEMKGLEVLVKYEYGTFDMLKKPLSTAGYVFVALIALYALRKVDIAIQPPKAVESNVLSNKK